jgi:hypothetical protein
MNVSRCVDFLLAFIIHKPMVAISIGLTINQGSNAVLKAEGFVSDKDSEVEKAKAYILQQLQ